MPRPAARSKASSALAASGRPVMNLVDLCLRLRVYVVIDPQYCLADPITVCRDVLAGGATSVQLRHKHSPDRDTLVLAEAMRALTTADGALFIVNDRLDLALASGADGVHLGAGDLPLAAARSIAGDGLVIGYSPETDEQARVSAQLGASYLGVGPVYGTASKADAGPAIGLETLIRRQALSGLPVVGIGGIDAANARRVIESGACGVAIMSAIIASPSPAGATRTIANELSAGRI